MSPLSPFSGLSFDQPWSLAQGGGGRPIRLSGEPQPPIRDRRGGRAQGTAPTASLAPVETSDQPPNQSCRSVAADGGYGAPPLRISVAIACASPPRSTTRSLPPLRFSTPITPKIAHYVMRFPPDSDFRSALRPPHRPFHIRYPRKRRILAKIGARYIENAFSGWGILAPGNRLAPTPATPKSRSSSTPPRHRPTPVL